MYIPMFSQVVEFSVIHLASPLISCLWAVVGEVDAVNQVTGTEAEEGAVVELFF
jgi:hypothetical protein